MSLYYKYFKMHLQSVMQHKVSFLLTAFGQFIVSFNTFLGIYFLFKRFHTLRNYSFEEVLMCFSIVLMQFAIAECYARGFDTFSTIISNGEFDRIMVRPRNVIVQVLGSRIEFGRLGRLLQGVIMLIYGISRSGIVWNFEKLVCLILMILGGSIIFSGIFLVYAALCFFTTQGLEFMNVFTDGAREHGKYPLEIYGKRVLQFCTYIIPFSLTQYYPLLYLFGRRESVTNVFLPVLSLLFMIPCYGIWRIGLKHYKSTGS